jgi:hypothetical protein
MVNYFKVAKLKKYFLIEKMTLMTRFPCQLKLPKQEFIIFETTTQFLILVG